MKQNFILPLIDWVYQVIENYSSHQFFQEIVTTIHEFFWIALISNVLIDNIESTVAGDNFWYSCKASSHKNQNPKLNLYESKDKEDSSNSWGSKANCHHEADLSVDKAVPGE